jgi:hypothetical protein
MRPRKIRQKELFDESPILATPELQKDVREEALQLLTQWLRALSQAMVQESRDEQDRH